jgi:hypothetical protein
MPLNEQDRLKLDGIVSQMESNGEKPENIQFVVNDFKSKYERGAAPATIAEMRRREEQGLVGALPPEQVQARVGSPEQLEEAVQDSKNVGQQEGGFLRNLKETFRGIGSAGSGVAGGEVLVAPIAGAETPEGQKYRQAARFQAATGAGIVAPELLMALSPEVAAGMTAAGATTKLGRVGQFLERGGAQALGGGTGGAATGAVEALPELARGEYKKAGETFGENILTGTALGPLISEVGVPLVAAGARQFVKPAYAAKEFLTGGGFSGAATTFFRPRYAPRVGSLETSQIRDTIESSTGVRVPLGVAEAIGEPGLVEAIKNAPIGAEVTPQHMESLKRLIVLNATELGGKNTGITSDELAKSAVDILRRRLGAVSKPYEDAIGTLSAQLKPSIDKGLIDVQNSANALIPGTASTPSFLGNIFRNVEQAGYNFFKQTDAKNFNGLRANPIYQQLKSKTSNIFEWANDIDAEAIQSLRTTPEESSLIVDQFGRKVVSKPSTVTTQGIPSTYPAETQKYVAAIGNMAPEQSIDAMRKYRTIIGDSIGNDSILPGISDRAKKQLYNAFTKDIEAAVDGVADKEFKTQFQNANKFHRENADNFLGKQVQSIIKNVGAEGGAGPASIARNLESADAPTFLNSIKRAAQPEDATAIDSAAREYLFNQAAKSGLDPVTGEISVSKVVNYINGLAPEIQSQFFPNAKEIASLAKKQSALAGLDPSKVISNLTVDAKLLSDAVGRRDLAIMDTIADAIKKKAEMEKQLRGTILGALKKASSSDVTDIVSQNPKKFISGIVDETYTPEQSRAALDMIGRESPMLVEQLQFQYVDDLIRKYSESGVLNSKQLASELTGESIVGKASKTRNYADAILGTGKVSKLKAVLENVARLEKLKTPVASNDPFAEAVIRGLGAATGEALGGFARVGPIGVANQAVRVAKLTPGVRYKIAAHVLSTPQLRELAMKPIGRFSKDELNAVLRGTAAAIAATEGEDAPDIDELQNLER